MDAECGGWSGTVARRGGQKAAASRMSSGPLFGSVACPVRMPPKSSPATQMHSASATARTSAGRAVAPHTIPAPASTNAAARANETRLACWLNAVAVALFRPASQCGSPAARPLNVPRIAAADHTPGRSMNYARPPHSTTQAARAQRWPSRLPPATLALAPAPAPATGAGGHAAGQDEQREQGVQDGGTGCPGQRIGHPRHPGHRAAGPFGQQPHREGPPNGGVQRRAGGTPPQQPGGQRELNGGERGVPRHHVVRDDPRRRGRRAGQQRWAAHARGFQHAGDEVPAEHIRLVLQGRIEQPYQAERDLQAAPQVGRVAVRCPGQGGPGGRRAAQRGCAATTEAGTRWRRPWPSRPRPPTAPGRRAPPPWSRRRARSCSG